MPIIDDFTLRVTFRLCHRIHFSHAKGLRESIHHKHNNSIANRHGHVVWRGYSDWFGDADAFSLRYWKRLQKFVYVRLSVAFGYAHPLLDVDRDIIWLLFDQPFA